MKIWAFHHLRFRQSKNRLFWGGERLRDYILRKITHPLPIVHDLWKFELSISYGLEKEKIAYFWVVRGCVTIFCEKSRILSLLCTICENLSFLSFTVLERVKSLILGCWEVAWLFCALYNLTVLYWGSRSPSPQGHKPSKERCCLLGWQQATEVIPQSGRVYILLSIVTLWDSWTGDNDHCSCAVIHENEVNDCTRTMGAVIDLIFMDDCTRTMVIVPCSTVSQSDNAE